LPSVATKQQDDGRIEQDEGCDTGTASHARAAIVRSKIILSILSILSRCSVVVTELPSVRLNGAIGSRSRL
jgi:hypothetical protein